jgi:hypothetical protein
MGIYYRAWLGLLSLAPLATCQPQPTATTSNAAPPPTTTASGLTVDLGYAVYQGSYNTTVGLNIWKGHVWICIAQKKKITRLT